MYSYAVNSMIGMKLCHFNDNISPVVCIVFGVLERNQIHIHVLKLCSVLYFMVEDVYLILTVYLFE